MRRERPAAHVWLLLPVALASVSLARGGVAGSTLPACSADGYGLEQAPTRPADANKAVRLTTGWLTAQERRRSCRLRTTVTLTISGSGGVAASATWRVNAVLAPYSSLVHTWVWRNWCSSTLGSPTLTFSDSSGKTVSQFYPRSPPCVNAAVASTVTALGTGTRYVQRPGDRIAPHILPSNTPSPFPVSLIKVTNAWLVSDGYTLVAVYAGTSGVDSSEGRFALVRQNAVFGIQYDPPDIVDIRNAGALEITGGPRGKSHETTAQKGKLAFVTANGARGVLDMRRDRIRILGRG